ncbi:MAG: hypothetical protein HFG35_10270 [Eubacterium sp.]|jgi:hypothetical protein|nr:hypothetical protein [Eubacterium sp.]
MTDNSFSEWAWEDFSIGGAGQKSTKTVRPEVKSSGGLSFSNMMMKIINLYGREKET